MNVLASSLLAKAVAHGEPKTDQTETATVPGNQTLSIYATRSPAGVKLLIRKKTTIETDGWEKKRRKMQKSEAREKDRLYKRVKPQPLHFVSFASAPWSSQSS